MPVHGVSTHEEKSELSSQLAFLYLEKADISALTPKELAAKYFEVKKEIYSVVSERGIL